MIVKYYGLGFLRYLASLLAALAISTFIMIVG